MARLTNPRRIKSKRIRPRYQKKEIIDMLKETDKSIDKQRNNNDADKQRENSKSPVISGNLQANFQKDLKYYGSKEASDESFWKDLESDNYWDVIKNIWTKARQGDLAMIKYLVENGAMERDSK